MQNEELWNQLTRFDIDGGPVELTFAARLARENGWSLGFAERVVREYRRFLYLAMEAGHPVTPSVQVDEAWHLHMTYSDSYWMRLNREVLPRPLLHGPTKGGAAEDAKFENWYSRTKASYCDAFGEEPPADIWPSSEQRFGRDTQVVRLNRNDYFFVSRDKVRRVAERLGVGALAFGGLTAVGFAAGSSKAYSSKVAFIILIMGGLFIWMAYELMKASRRRGRHSSGGGSGCGGFGCGTSSGCGNESTADSGSSSGCSSGCGGGGCGGGGD